MVYKFTSLKEYTDEVSEGLSIVLFSAIWCKKIYLLHFLYTKLFCYNGLKILSFSQMYYKH